MIVLGLETTCDETAAAVVTDAAAPDARILSNKVLSQFEDHRPYGGVVPEIAARSHLRHIDSLVEAALDEAGARLSRLDGVAVTAGPGLIGGVMVGVMTAKAIAAAHDLPFVAVNHLEAHALTVRLTDHAAFPYLLLLVSGGHCQLLIVDSVGRCRRLGTTVDDAVGEAFDKTAKLLGLGYPGGPAVEAAARAGRPERFELPRPMQGRAGCDFSFSGLKTAVRQRFEALGNATPADVADLCAAFQEAVVDSLIDRCGNAIAAFRDNAGDSAKTLVVAGGVAANAYLRSRLTEAAERSGLTLLAPPPRLCTDNAAMVAWVGIERLKRGLTDGLDFRPRPRWPLDSDAPPAIGAGVKA